MEGEWIEYDGEGIPVGDFQLVDLKLDCGEIILQVNAGEYDWDVWDTEEDISAYRIAQ